MSNTRNVKLVVEYDGTNYRGWQVQPDCPTIQGELERAVKQITGETLRITGAGRTDAGVHALGQVANFHTSSPMPVEKVRRAMNAVLPDYIVVLGLSEVPESFNARHSAKSKRYRYTILNRSSPSALQRYHTIHVAYPLDVAAMKEATGHLIGTLDFSSFACNSGKEDDPVRTVMDVLVERRDDYVIVEMEAISFLYKMVRSIVGTLVDVGRGQLKPSDVLGMLMARDRRISGPTAPARGLTLIRVDY
ncbi:MAG: tRNA pseudouridine(38-40) synthase TruA [bacterium]